MDLWSEGEALYERVIKQQDEFNLYDKWYVLWAYGVLIQCLRKQDKKAKVLVYIKDLHAYHQTIFRTENIFGFIYDLEHGKRLRQNGDFEKSEEMCFKMIKRVEKALGSQSWLTLGAKADYAETLLCLHRTDEAY